LSVYSPFFAHHLEQELRTLRGLPRAERESLNLRFLVPNRNSGKSGRFSWRRLTRWTWPAVSWLLRPRRNQMLWWTSPTLEHCF